KGGCEKASQFMEALKMIAIVTHVADARSCVLHPASTTHRQLSKADLDAIGIADNLIRLSVGIENAEDIIADLEQALNQI
ncbi:MAG: O-acetylhomoserine aminocarboxypropyltransferase/cysteine synthase, partial [Clostridia bacterium]|nr:O-acetylhomoserine aminocarboxypropyltransferase/cysteine synthase [Clostridia bacterium]